MMRLQCRPPRNRKTPTAFFPETAQLISRCTAINWQPQVTMDICRWNSFGKICGLRTRWKSPRSGCKKCDRSWKADLLVAMIAVRDGRRLAVSAVCGNSLAHVRVLRAIALRQVYLLSRRRPFFVVRSRYDCPACSMTTSIAPPEIVSNCTTGRCELFANSDVFMCTGCP